MVNKKILFFVYVLYIFFVIVINLFYMKHLPQKYLYNEGWEIYFYNENRIHTETKSINLPFSRMLKKNEMIILKRKIILEGNDHLYLYLNDILDNLVIYKNNQKVYSHGIDYPVGKRYHIISLQKEKSNTITNQESSFFLEIRICAQASFHHKITQVAILPHIELLKFLFRNDIVFYMITGFVFSLAIIFLSAFFYNSGPRGLLFSGLLLLMISIWNMSLIPSLHIISIFEKISPYSMKLSAILLLPIFAMLNYQISGIKIFLKFGIYFFILGLIIFVISGFSRLNYWSTSYFLIYAFFVLYVFYKYTIWEKENDNNAIIIILNWTYLLSFFLIIIDIGAIIGFIQVDYLFNQWLSPAYVFSLTFYIFLKTSTDMRKREMYLKKLSDIRYKNLLTSMNPHFLFNSLSTVFSLIYKNPELAKEGILYLSDIYRHIILSGGKDSVILEDEWNDLESYSRLLMIRFPNRYAFDLYLSSSLKKRTIPPLVLHTIIESIYRNQKSERIEISVHIKEIKDFEKNKGMKIEIVSKPPVNTDRQITRALSNIESYYKKAKQYVFKTKSRLVLRVIIYDSFS